MKSMFSWLKNSTQIKRWLFMMIIGMILFCYGFAQVLVVDRLELMDLVRIIISFVVGLTTFTIGIIFIQRRTLEMAISPDVADEKNNMININDKGPKIVVIGGGSGISNVLKGLKKYTNNITAIVTVSNYGNKETGTNEDMKNSIIALANDSISMKKLINASESYNKKNKDFGDIYLETSSKVFGGQIEGLVKTSNVLSIIGKVLPVTLNEMNICAELDNGMIIKEKEKIATIVAEKITKINRVYLSPANCKVTPGVIEAIKEADAIIIGPGSLYINIIPNLLIRNVAKTIKESKAYKIYISNIMTEPGNTDDYDVAEHINAIVDHVGKGIIDYCICDNGDIIPEFLRKYNKEGSSLVEINADKLKIKGIKLLKEDVSCVEGEKIRHSPDEIAKAIIEIICNDLKFKDKQDEQYVLLNSKLKEQKKGGKHKKIIKQKHLPKSEKKASKFANKYKDRIESIQNSEETKEENRKLYETIHSETKEEEKVEKEEYIKTIMKK